MNKLSLTLVVLLITSIQVISSKVFVLNHQNFENEVSNIQKTWLINFYSPSCGYCKSFEPVLDRLSNIIKEKINVAKIDCTEKKNENVCQGFKVEEYPTIKFVLNGRVYDYKKKRNEYDIKEFMERGFSSESSIALPGHETTFEKFRNLGFHYFKLIRVEFWIIYYQKTHLIYWSIGGGSLMGVVIGSYIAMKIYNKVEKKEKLE
eukprot:gene3994-7250_t